MLIPSPQALATYLKDEREKRGLSQSELGENVGLRQKTISDFENNPSNTRIETLFKMLAALNLQIHAKEADTSEPSSWKEEW